MDIRSEDELRKPPKAVIILMQVIKWAFIVGLIIMIGWMMLRGAYQKGTAKMKRYYFTEDAAALYEADQLEVEKLLDFNDNTLGRTFYIGNIHYTAGISQFQFMLRYNKFNELIASTVAEHGLHCFTFALVDNNGKTYTEYEYITDHALMYGYYRVAFSGVDLSEATELKVYVFFDSGEAVSLSDAINSCVVWYSDGYKEDYDLSRAEKKSEKPHPAIEQGSTDLTDNTTEEGDA